MSKRHNGTRAQKSKRQREQEKLLRLMKDNKSKKQKKCSTGKRIFDDKVSALLAVAENQRKDKQWRSKTEKRAYECPECYNWHITSRESWDTETMKSNINTEREKDTRTANYQNFDRVRAVREATLKGKKESNKGSEESVNTVPSPAMLMNKKTTVKPIV